MKILFMEDIHHDFTDWFRKPGDFLIDMREKGLSDGSPESSLVNPLYTVSVSLLLELTAMHNRAWSRAILRMLGKGMECMAAR